jgi:hypothetical protein
MLRGCEDLQSRLFEVRGFDFRTFREQHLGSAATGVNAKIRKVPAGTNPNRAWVALPDGELPTGLSILRAMRNRRSGRCPTTCAPGAIRRTSNPTVKVASEYDFIGPGAAITKEKFQRGVQSGACSS